MSSDPAATDIERPVHLRALLGGTLVVDSDKEDLFLKVSQMYWISSSSDHPAVAATFIDYLVNSPGSGRTFGTNRGVPASQTARDAAELDGISTQIAEYESSITNASETHCRCP